MTLQIVLTVAFILVCISEARLVHNDILLKAQRRTKLGKLTYIDIGE